MTTEPLSLYIHIPFCSLKCRYCDFNSYAGIEELVPPFVDALVDEVRLWGEVVGRQSQGWGPEPRAVETVFLGGGTPSLLPLGDIERIMAALRDSFHLAPDTEVSLEANPGTVDEADLRGLVGLGVNRLSFGVQSFHDDELASLDRIHTAQETRDGYRWAREAGFRRVNLDLIYGLPGQPIAHWQASLEEALALAPEHLSLYALTVEDGTPLAYDVAQGTTPEPDPDVQAEMYEWSMERLVEAGYAQYEISNWARPGEECRHNLVYWRNGEWLGLGPGAHSHWGTNRGQGTRDMGDRVAYRFANVYSPKQYIERVRETVERGGSADSDTASLITSMRQVAFSEPQTEGVAMADTAILALRLNEGLSLLDFRARFGRELDDVNGAALSEVTSLGLLERENGRVRLTPRGRLLANEVFVRLLPE